MQLYSESNFSNQSTSTESKKQRSCVVFLHGLLGSRHDWETIIAALSPEYDCINIDLPGHGRSQDIIVSGFEQVQQLIINTLAQYDIKPIILVGYSLGARVAMQIACQPEPEWCYPLQGLLLESGHTGLSSKEAEQRWQHDSAWANRFQQEPLAQVLSDWYQQPVFASLTEGQRAEYIATRSCSQDRKASSHAGAQISRMLKATSLAKQGDFLLKLKRLPYPVQVLCGKQDPKFHRLAQQSQLSYQAIDQVGHNIHAELPELFSQLVRQFIATTERSLALEPSTI
ncbi:MAG: 2-succinyl-6-hydroxy-2,4-cyclohexadiene-1-carboxylate synthase [Moritella sp.]|jgi:2-succinyl-6-hydroxy-2,4-cyclohexadiene-1-carboxylate synthase